MTEIAIIGSGPSALFTAKTILENTENIRVSVYERGKSPQERKCRMQKTKCKSCQYCDVINGGGGAGLFSDGKLVLDLNSGGNSAGITNLSLDNQEAITTSIKRTFERFDGVSEFKDVPSFETQEKYTGFFAQRGLEIKYYPVMHMGTSNLHKITCNFIDYLSDEFGKRISFHFETEVLDILELSDECYRLITNHGKMNFSAIVLAVGKAGACWLKEILRKFKCSFFKHDYFFGLRIETRACNISDLLNISLDPKIYRIKNDRKIKLHCVCRNGDIRYYNYNGTLCVGGHSPYTSNNFEINQMNRANFNVMSSFNKEQIPPDELLRKFRCVSGQRIMGQRLGDFFENRRTNTWGMMVPQNQEIVYKWNIREVVDSFDWSFSRDVIDFIRDIAALNEGMADVDNIVYAPAIEWDMDTVKVNDYMETTQKNIFAVGDGAGISQGIVYSAATGIIAGYEIALRFGI